MSSKKESLYLIGQFEHAVVRINGEEHDPENFKKQSHDVYAGGHHDRFINPDLTSNDVIDHIVHQKDGYVFKAGLSGLHIHIDDGCISVGSEPS